jgi:hypothetical protein
VWNADYYQAIENFNPSHDRNGVAHGMNEDLGVYCGKINSQEEKFADLV